MTLKNFLDLNDTKGKEIWILQLIGDNTLATLYDNKDKISEQILNLEFMDAKEEDNAIEMWVL